MFSYEGRINLHFNCCSKTDKFILRSPTRPTTPEEFENGGFTLKLYQIFPSTLTSREFQNTAITVQFGFLFEENLGEKSRDYRDVIVFIKLSFQMFSIH